MVLRRREARLWRRRSPGRFTLDGAIDGVDQHLGFDEFEPRPFGIGAVERCGKGFGKRVAVVRHALARLFQRLKSLAHVGFAFCWLRSASRKAAFGCEGCRPEICRALVFELGRPSEPENST